MMRYPVVYGSAIDSLILAMIDYCIMEQTCRKREAMTSFFHRVERTDFVFTGRTRVRLGGFNYVAL